MMRARKTKLMIKDPFCQKRRLWRPQICSIGVLISLIKMKLHWKKTKKLKKTRKPSKSVEEVGQK